MDESKGSKSLIRNEENEANVSKLSAAERAEERRKKLIWDEAVFEAGMQKGNLIITWKPIYTINPIIYDFEKTQHHKLKCLRLIGVELMELPEEFGLQLRQLELLSVENNKLETLPDSVTEMIHLVEFNLSFNRLQYLPERIGFMFRLRVMPLNNNQLTQLPITFGALTALEKLDLECNYLRVLPENLDHLQSCHTINVNRNNLIRLARCLSRMPNLTYLSACWNQLSYIPQELYASKTITHLRLGMNGISRISEKLGEMQQLHELILDYNKVIKLPLSTWKLKNLKVFRMEGNEELLDPPTEIVIQGAKVVVDYFTNIFLSDKQARMRHIILTTQNILQQITDRKIYHEAFFEPDIKVEENSEDYWFGFQFSYFWSELLPKLNQVWKYFQSKGMVIPDIITEFEFSEKEVLWAFTNFRDAYGPVMLHQRAMFRQCACKDSHGQPMPCVPPRQGYMCQRMCYLIKKHIVRQRDKEDRIWQAYKTQSLIDAEKRAEVEANTYLQSSAGKRWVDDSAYEQAEEMMLETGAAKVVEKRIHEAEKKKKKIIKKYNKKINKIQKLRDEKVVGIQEELNKLKETRKLAREGYLRDGIEFKINELTTKLSQMPESIELDNLHKQCEAECERIDEALYASSSSENDEDIHHTSDDDSHAYSTDDSTQEAKKWRKRRERRLKKENQEKLLQLMKRKYHKDEEKEKKSHGPLHQIGDTIDKYVMKPVFNPIGRSINRTAKQTHYRTSKALRNIKEISRIRVRKLLFKVIGTFDEVQKELKYEISRQYVEHQVNLAREKARKEFHVIEEMRQKFKGVSKEKAFIAWKKWVWTKQKRIARDLRRQYKTAFRWYNSAMESVRSAQIQVDMWIPEYDIYSDTPFWRHAKTGAITFDHPTVYFYLPPNFKIPEQPPPLPEGVDINEKTSSSEDSLTGWQSKYGQRRRNFLRTASSSQRRGNLGIEEDYHDDIINSNVLQVNEDDELGQVIADDNSSVQTAQQLQNYYQQRNNQSFRKTMRQAGDALPLLQARAQRQQQADNFPAQSGVDGTVGFMRDGSAQTNRGTPKSRHILAMTQLNSPFDTANNGLDMLEDTLKRVTLPAIEPSPRPDNLQDVVVHVRAKANDEFERAYKVIRKKRNQLNPARHTTYMNQATRKERSFEQIKGELANIEEGSSSMIEVESGVFVSTKGVKDLVNPTDEELFRLAGGSLDMKNLGKKGIDYRTILAKRALHIKEKLYEQAVQKGLAKPKRYNFYRREIRPLFVDVYHDSDSEDEEEVERRKKEAKAALRAKRREERMERKKMTEKLESEEDQRSVSPSKSIRLPSDSL